MTLIKINEAISKLKLLHRREPRGVSLHSLEPQPIFILAGQPKHLFAYKLEIPKLILSPDAAAPTVHKLEPFPLLIDAEIKRKPGAGRRRVDER